MWDSRFLHKSSLKWLWYLRSQCVFLWEILILICKLKTLLGATQSPCYKVNIKIRREITVSIESSVTDIHPNVNLNIDFPMFIYENVYKRHYKFLLLNSFPQFLWPLWLRCDMTIYLMKITRISIPRRNLQLKKVLRMVTTFIPRWGVSDISHSHSQPATCKMLAARAECHPSRFHSRSYFAFCKHFANISQW